MIAAPKVHGTRPTLWYLQDSGSRAPFGAFLTLMKQTFYAVLVLASPLLAQVTINGLPTREFGQPTLVAPPTSCGYLGNLVNSASPNLVEGRELFQPSAIAFDASVTPPRVYIVDTGNNRVLGWSNANSLTQGNFADLVIGQNSDFTSTCPYGPGTSLSTGLFQPSGVAVDAAGNVYISDSGNNRILRFKTPYAEAAGNLIVDLLIGQKSVAATTASSNNQANQGQQNPSSTSLFLSVANSAGQIVAAGLAIDGSGNLWVADPGNNRVLRFPVASLAANTQLPVADIVLGQTSFTSNQLAPVPPNSCAFQAQCDLSLLETPTSVALDTQGNVYVADGIARVLVFSNPTLGGAASKVLGVVPNPTQQNPTLKYPTASTLGSLNSAGNSLAGSPQGVFVLNGPSGTSVFVCDSPQSRVVRYDSLAVPANANSPAQSGVVGQVGFTSGQVNQGLTGPTNQTFDYPVTGAIRPDDNEMWVVDQFNHRVVAFANQGGGVYGTASRVVGQTDFIYNGANLIEGREIWVSGFGAGIVVDPNSTPPHLYIADSLNNRVLGFNDARKVGTDARSILTQKADLVIGQTDLLHNLVNSPNNTPGQPTATGLYRPVGLAVDANGNLWVADSGNGRAVRFPAPFAQPANATQTANVVEGQPDFVTFTPNVSQFNMVQPFGLTLFASGSLAVSDANANRVLVFNKPAGDFANGAKADLVIGQPSFSQFGSGNSSNQMSSPRHIAVDSSDRLFVCDSGNNRLMVFSKPTASTPAAGLLVPGLNQPQGITVSFITGRSWVTSTAGNLVYQLPEYDTLQNTQQSTQGFQSYGPLAVALDPFDNVIVADSANRITFYFAKLYYRSTASYAAGVGSSTGPTPTMLAALAREGSNFNFTTSYTGAAANLGPPWPQSLNNVQVAVSGIPAPIFRIDPAVVLVEIPNGAPSSGSADFVVSNPTTGQILAVATFTMYSAAPGLYTANSQGTGPGAVSNYDSKGNYLGINSAANPVTAGGIITLWLTGAGNVPGLPADGTAPGQAFNTHSVPTVLINGQVAQVLGSVMSPQYPGLWQINAVVPNNTPSSSISPISVAVSMDDVASNIGGGANNPDGSPAADRPLLLSNGLITTIYVK